MARLVDKQGTPAWKWKVKSNSVKLAKLNSGITDYLNILPEEVQNEIIATSGNDSNHGKISRHYKNNAIDLEFSQKVWDYIEKDPNRLKYGLTLLDPNHGTAKHIHLSHGNGTENHDDVWMNPYSDKAKQFLANNPSSVSTPTETSIPTSTTTTEIIQPDNSALAASLEKMYDKIQSDSQKLESNKLLMSQEQERITYEKNRIVERDSILEGILNNPLEYVGRSHNMRIMEEGGTMDGFDSDVMFKMKQIQAMTPPVDESNLNSLQEENSILETQIKETQNLLQQAMLIKQSQSPGSITTTTTEITPEFVPDKAIEGNSSADIESTAGIKRAIFEELTQLGLNKVQISGVIGSLSGESGKHLDTKAIGDNGTSVGIAQWHKTRKNSLINFSKKNNLDYTTGAAQVKYLRHELETTHKHVLDKMLKTTTVEDATKVWTNVFEIPSTAAYRNSIGKRIQFARDYFNSVK